MKKDETIKNKKVIQLGACRDASFKKAAFHWDPYFNRYCSRLEAMRPADQSFTCSFPQVFHPDTEPLTILVDCA